KSSALLVDRCCSCAEPTPQAGRLGAQASAAPKPSVSLDSRTPPQRDTAGEGVAALKPRVWNHGGASGVVAISNACALEEDAMWLRLSASVILALVGLVGLSLPALA